MHARINKDSEGFELSCATEKVFITWMSFLLSKAFISFPFSLPLKPSKSNLYILF